jgi:Helicase associated domain
MLKSSHDSIVAQMFWPSVSVFEIRIMLFLRQHRHGRGQRRVGAATTTTTTTAIWWLFFSIIWRTTTFLFEIQQIPVPCGGYSLRLPLSRLTAARPNPNRLLLSVQSPIPDNNNTGAKPYYATAKENETADRRLSLRTESHAKEWNATSTSNDNDRYCLINHSSGNSRQAQWIVMFEKLKEYKALHGDCLVKDNYKCDDGRRLGLWVQNQRKARYTSEDGKRLGEQRRQALDSIGFVWIVKERGRQLSPETGQYASAAERFNARWNARFEQLKEYREVHGHCLVPYKYECADGTKLGDWVSMQRTAGSSDSEMNLMRRQALDAIGFVWQVREPLWTGAKQWNKMFRRLQEYEAAHGDCLVPRHYVTKDKKPLGSWVRTQRKAWASGKLFKNLYKDRLEKLQSIGFELRAMPDDSDESRWTRLVGQLVEYQRQHGDCLVPKRYPEDQVLGFFVSRLRNEYDRMSRDRREQLDAIGFVWDGRDATDNAKWNDMFEQLRQYQTMHGVCNVPRSYDDKLARWVYRQRTATKLLPDRQATLQSIGFFC